MPPKPTGASPLSSATHLQNVTPLPNPPIDATSMAAARNAGFVVVEGINLTRDKMTNGCSNSQENPRRGCCGVFLCRHGIAIDGINYLLPVDADITSEMDVKLATRSTSILPSTRP